MIYPAFQCHLSTIKSITLNKYCQLPRGVFTNFNTSELGPNRSTLDRFRPILRLSWMEGIISWIRCHVKTVAASSQTQQYSTCHSDGFLCAGSWIRVRAVRPPPPTWWLLVIIILIRHFKGWFMTSLIARFMGPTWGPSGADRTQVGPMLAPWTLLSGVWSCIYHPGDGYCDHRSTMLMHICRFTLNITGSPNDFQWGSWKYSGWLDRYADR